LRDTHLTTARGMLDAPPEADMKRVPVFYATTEGQTRRIAEAIAASLRYEGLDSEALELAATTPLPDWSQLAGAVVGASVHAGHHQREASAFIKREAHQLEIKPSAFFSVSLSAGSRNPKEVDRAWGMATNFVRSMGWEPSRLACFAGRLAYTKYGFLKRWMMQRIAAREGAPTDTSRDHEFTDWAIVREFARAFAKEVRGDAIVRRAS
jgi:menaquinone-dependent protoporphyrinogen oxidase